MPDRRHGKGTERKEFIQPECDRTPEKGLRTEQQPINSPNKLSWECWDLWLSDSPHKLHRPPGAPPHCSNSGSVLDQSWWEDQAKDSDCSKRLKSHGCCKDPGRQRDKVHLKHPRPLMNARTELTRVRGPPAGGHWGQSNVGGASVQRRQNRCSLYTHCPSRARTRPAHRAPDNHQESLHGGSSCQAEPWLLTCSNSRIWDAEAARLTTCLEAESWNLSWCRLSV